MMATRAVVRKWRTPRRQFSSNTPKASEAWNRTLDVLDSVKPSTTRSPSALINPAATSVVPSSALIGMMVPKTTKEKHAVYSLPPLEDPALRLLSSLIMKHGKRANADRRVSRMLLQIGSMGRAPPLELFRAAMTRVKPLCRVMNHKSPAGKLIPKPVALNDKQSTHQGIKWLLEASEKKEGIHVEDRLSKEIFAVLRGESNAITQKADIHKYAMINRYVLTVQPGST